MRGDDSGGVASVTSTQLPTKHLGVVSAVT